MISRDELLVQAKAFDLSEANVQRDYVFGWIVSGIFRESSLADRATLKGGNALRKRPTRSVIRAADAVAADRARGMEIGGRSLLRCRPRPATGCPRQRSMPPAAPSLELHLEQNLDGHLDAPELEIRQDDANVC